MTDRLRELNHDRYGSLTSSADGYPCSDRGFDNWIFQGTLDMDHLPEAEEAHV